jgi:hypothetical protein
MEGKLGDGCGVGRRGGRLIDGGGNRGGPGPFRPASGAVVLCFRPFMGLSGNPMTGTVGGGASEESGGREEQDQDQRDSFHSQTSNTVRRP